MELRDHESTMGLPRYVGRLTSWAYQLDVLPRKLPGTKKEGMDGNRRRSVSGGDPRIGSRKLSIFPELTGLRLTDIVWTGMVEIAMLV